MSVHSLLVDQVALCMNFCAPVEPLPIETGDPDWVADLFETMQAGDLDAVVDQLDALLQTMREAARARRMLATVGPDLLRAGLALRIQRAAP